MPILSFLIPKNKFCLCVIMIRVLDLIVKGQGFNLGLSHGDCIIGKYSLHICDPVHPGVRVGYHH